MFCISICSFYILAASLHVSLASASLPRTARHAGRKYTKNHRDDSKTVDKLQHTTMDDVCAKPVIIGVPSAQDQVSADLISKGVSQVRQLCLHGENAECSTVGSDRIFKEMTKLDKEIDDMFKKCKNDFELMKQHWITGKAKQFMLK